MCQLAEEMIEIRGVAMRSLPREVRRALRTKHITLRTWVRLANRLGYEPVFNVRDKGAR